MADHLALRRYEEAALQIAPALALTPQDQQQRDVALVARRQAREDHHHKQIWSKHPHGGSYCKVPTPVVPFSGQQKSDLPSWATAGYEQVKVGKTTSFVGDAMSQGAIDAVHEQLKKGHNPKLTRHTLDIHWSRAARSNDTAKPSEPPAPPCTRCATLTAGLRETASIAQSDVGSSEASRGLTAGVQSAEALTCQACAERDEATQRFRKLWGRLTAQGKIPVTASQSVHEA